MFGLSGRYKCVTEISSVEGIRSIVRRDKKLDSGSSDLSDVGHPEVLIGQMLL